MLRRVHQGMEGLGYEAVARLEGVHPRTVHHWVERAQQQAAMADQAVIEQVTTEAVEMDELHSFAGTKQTLPEPAPETGQQWVHCSMARESRWVIDLEVGPGTEETATKLLQATAERVAAGCFPLWSSDGWKPYVDW